jgi:hypothetical protein
MRWSQPFSAPAAGALDFRFGGSLPGRFVGGARPAVTEASFRGEVENLLMLLHSTSSVRFKEYKDEFASSMASALRERVDKADALAKVEADKKAAEAKKSETWTEVQISVVLGLLLKGGWYVLLYFLNSALSITRLHDVFKHRKLPLSVSLSPDVQKPMTDSNGDRIFYRECYSQQVDAQGHIITTSDADAGVEEAVASGSTKRPANVAEAFGSTRRWLYSCVIASHGMTFNGLPWMTSEAVAGYLELLHVVSLMPGLTLYVFTLVRDESVKDITALVNCDTNPCSFDAALRAARAGLESDMKAHRKANAMWAGRSPVLPAALRRPRPLTCLCLAVLIRLWLVWSLNSSPFRLPTPR